MSHELPSQELIDDVRAGHLEAGEVLGDYLLHKLLKEARKPGLNKHDQEDAVQDAILRILLSVRQQTSHPGPVGKTVENMTDHEKAHVRPLLTPDEWAVFQCVYLGGPRDEQGRSAAREGS